MGNFFSNTIGRKLIMSVTGLFLILFLLFHASMNLVVVFSPEAYD
ncbi:MAG: succinate dehydrogenase/fumarate reductase cytochrome b subunit, partial [Rikenellaceae bacterium]